MTLADLQDFNRRMAVEHHNPDMRRMFAALVAAFDDIEAGRMTPELAREHAKKVIP